MKPASIDATVRAEPFPARAEPFDRLRANGEKEPLRLSPSTSLRTGLSKPARPRQMQTPETRP